MKHTIDEVRRKSRVAKAQLNNKSAECRALERKLCRATAVAWVGEITRDDDGDYDGNVWPVSPEVASDRYHLSGDKIKMTFSDGYDRDSLTLLIGGEEQGNFFVDLSGSVKFRAFCDRAEAVRWVERKATVQDA